jgi:hypothetical protein
MALSPQAQRRVRRAVATGRALEDPHEAAAAVELARKVQHTTVASPPRWWAVALGVIVLMVAAGLAVSGNARPPTILIAFGVAISLVAVVGGGWWLPARRLQRAYEAEQRNRANVT